MREHPGERTQAPDRRRVAVSDAHTPAAPQAGQAAHDAADEPDEQPLFEPCDPQGDRMRCTVCGAVNQIRHRSVASMLGHGLDTSATCTVCGSTALSGPEWGSSVRRKPWPPTEAPYHPAC